MLRYDSFGLQVDAIWRSRCYTNTCTLTTLFQILCFNKYTRFSGIHASSQQFATRNGFEYFVSTGRSSLDQTSLASSIQCFRCGRAGCPPDNFILALGHNAPWTFRSSVNCPPSVQNVSIQLPKNGCLQSFFSVYIHKVCGNQTLK